MKGVGFSIDGMDIISSPEAFITALCGPGSCFCSLCLSLASSTHRAVVCRDTDTAKHSRLQGDGAGAGAGSPDVYPGSVHRGED